MSSSTLIRLGGLAAIAGGVAYTVLGLAVWYLEPRHSPEVQLLYNIFFVFLVLGALAATVALHTLHKEFDVRTESLVSLVASVGLLLLLVGGLGDVLDLSSYFTSLQWGLTLAALGGASLAVVTIAARVLPWWCAVAIIVGSLGFAAAGLFGELFAALAGTVWALVGYAVFRAAGQRAERPPRVR
jgi:hypothetical protein